MKYAKGADLEIRLSYGSVGHAGDEDGGEPFLLMEMDYGNQHFAAATPHDDDVEDAIDRFVGRLKCIANAEDNLGPWNYEEIGISFEVIDSSASDVTLVFVGQHAGEEFRTDPITFDFTALNDFISKVEAGVNTQVRDDLSLSPPDGPANVLN